MENSTSSQEFKIHLDPVWRKKANSLLHASISEDYQTVEQLWARRVAGNRFEICCIPFFVYDLALGDEVEAVDYVFQRVVKSSGHYTFRVWLGESTDSQIRDRLTKAIARIGCTSEWYSTDLFAIDAGSEGQAQELADLLTDEERRGTLAYETGRTV